MRPRSHEDERQDDDGKNEEEYVAYADPVFEYLIEDECAEHLDSDEEKDGEHCGNDKENREHGPCSFR